MSDDFFAPTEGEPKVGHRWAEIQTGPSEIYGRWTCIKGSSMGVRYSWQPIDDATRAAFKNEDCQRAHMLMFSCVDFTELTD